MTFGTVGLDSVRVICLTRLFSSGVEIETKEIVAGFILHLHIAHLLLNRND